MGRKHLLAVWVLWLVAGSTNAFAFQGTVTVSPATSSSSPYNLGSVVIGSTTPVATFTIHDSHNGDTANISEISSACTSGGTFNLTIGGTTATSFSGLSLNSDISLGVSFKPSSNGTFVCKIEVIDAANTSNHVSFYVEGIGLRPAAAMLSATSIAFGSIRDNTAAPNSSVTKTITVSNTGDAPLSIMSVKVTGTGFSLMSGPAMVSLTGTGTAGDHATWTILFQSTSVGNQSGSITFTDGGSTTWGTATLSGTITAAQIEVSTAITGGFAALVNAGSTPSVDITVHNQTTTFQGPLGVTQASITPGTLVNGVNWFSFSSCNGTPTTGACTFSPALSITTTDGTVGITCSVPSTAMVGDTESATVSFTSDTDTGGTTSVSLTCNAGVSSFKAEDAGGASQVPIQFTPQLVGTPATQLQTFKAVNTGNTSISFYLSITGADAANFTATTPGCGTSASDMCTLPAQNDSVTITVSFAPQVENSVSATLNLVNGASYPQISLGGLGIDKHVNVIGPTMDAEAFRNPGTDAPTVPVTIQNTGRYMLTVSAIDVEAAPVWTLAGAPSLPLVVPGGDGTTPGTTTVMVAFAPTATGRAPDGMLSLTTDDTRTTDISTATFTGNGENRDVAMGPTTIELGETGAGIPIHLTVVDPMNLLTVTNNDAMNTFHIREFQVTGDPGFTVAMPNGDPFSPSDIVNGSPQSFDVVFSPPDLGDFNGTIELFLDQDTVPQAFVPVHGSALFVGAHGGGCDAGGGGGAGGAAVALGMLLAGRRRRGSHSRRQA